MREFSTPATYVVPTDGNLTDDVLGHLRRDPAAVLLRRQQRGSDTWSDVTARAFHDEVTAVAKGLLAAGIERGDRVGLLSRTRYEWTLIDYAIWWVGAVTVPLYETSTADQARWFLADSAAVACVVERPDHARRVASVRDDLPCLRQVWIVDDGAVATLTAQGGGVADDALEQRRSAIVPESLATLVYTSGSTGRPRGCRLTHGNFMAEAGTATEALDELFAGNGASTLVFLPLAHVFARVLQVGCIRSGTTLGHTSDVTELVHALGGFRPTFVLGVPRVFEKVHTAASQQATVAGRGRVFAAAVSTAIAWSQALDEGRPGPLLRARHAVFDRLVYKQLRATLGGRVRYAVSGGAPLGDRLGHVFRGVGVPVLEGYGLTETTAAVTVNRPGEQKMGTVGRPLPGVTVRVGDDGELLFRGDQVFAGYWGDDEQITTASAGALARGWFHTGDIGEVDGEGFVRVTGRKREILVTAGGKQVAPSVLEERIRVHPLVSQCMVVGDGKPYVAALVTLDEDSARTWARAHARPADVAELADDPDLRDEIRSAVDAANETVSQAESVRRFRVLPVDWTEEGGHLTPSLKLKRALVMQDFRREVEALYG